MNGGEDSRAVVGAREHGVVGDVAEAASDEALMAGGYSGCFMETLLDGKGRDSW